MNSNSENLSSRREFLKTSSALAVGAIMRFLVILLVALLNQAVGQVPVVKLIRAPEAGLQPQACVDAVGTVHLIYGKSGGELGWSPGDLFYVRMKPGEKEFSRPIRVNSQPKCAVAVTTAGGGQLAVGKEGRVHIVWNGACPPAPKGEGAAKPSGEGGEKKKKEGGDIKPLFYARLNDDGTAFEPQQNVAGRTEALDGAGTIAADGSGNVYILWHARGETPGEGYRRVYLAHSTDDGKIFGAESRVSSPLAGACSCCSMRALTDAEGRLFAAFRGAGTGVHRDSFLLVSPKPGGPFEEVKLGESEPDGKAILPETRGMPSRSWTDFQSAKSPKFTEDQNNEETQRRGGHATASHFPGRVA